MSTDDVIEAAVKEELSKQAKDKYKLEAEFKKKTGTDPHFAAKESTLIKVLDEPRDRRKQ